MLNKKRIIISDKAEDKILDLLENNGLKESKEERFKKLKENKKSFLYVLFDITKKFARKEITEEKVSPLLQKELDISPEKSDKIKKEIEKEVIPFLEEVEIKSSEESVLEEENENEPSTPPVEKEEKPIPGKKAKANKSSQEEEEEEEEEDSKNKKSSPDNYREPIS